MIVRGILPGSDRLIGMHGQFERHETVQKKADFRSAAEIARLAIKAGIDQLSPAALYGAFLQIAADAADPEKLAGWEAKGQRGLRAAENDNRVVAVAKFAAKPAADTMAGLRKLGFRWNSILGQFEGRVAYDEAAAFVTKACGTIERVGAAERLDKPG